MSAAVAAPAHLVSCDAPPKTLEGVAHDHLLSPFQPVGAFFAFCVKLPRLTPDRLIVDRVLAHHVREHAHRRSHLGGHRGRHV